MFRRRIECVDSSAFIFLRDDVHDAGNGIGSVDRRCAVFEDLDTVNSRQRNGVQIKCRHGALYTRRPRATTVQQYQGTVRTETAQADRVRAETTVFDKLAGDRGRHLRRSGRDARRLQQGGDVGDALDGRRLG